MKYYILNQIFYKKIGWIGYKFLHYASSDAKAMLLYKSYNQGERQDDKN